MTQLYELTGQIKELNDMADDPEMLDAVSDTLELLHMEVQEKAENIISLVKNRDSDIEAIEKEIDRLSGRKKQIKNFQDRLRDYLKVNMEAQGIKKIDCPLFTITLAKGRDIAVIDNADDLEDDFVKVETTVKPIKEDILKALKDGIDVKGAHLEKGNNSIRIK